MIIFNPFLPVEQPSYPLRYPPPKFMFSFIVLLIIHNILFVLPTCAKAWAPLLNHEKPTSDHVFKDSSCPDSCCYLPVAPQR